MNFTVYGKSELVYKEARPQKDLAGADKEKEYRYNPAGKVDPFLPFLLEQEIGAQDIRKTDGGRAQDETAWQTKMKEMLEKLREPKTELQRFDLSDLTFSAIVRTKEGEVKAMVVDPTGRGYVLEKGTYIGKMGGVVDSIICEEKEGPFGTESVRKIVIKEPFFNQERKLDYKFKEMQMPFKETYK